MEYVPRRAQKNAKSKSGIRSRQGRQTTGNKSEKQFGVSSKLVVMTNRQATKTVLRHFSTSGSVSTTAGGAISQGVISGAGTISALGSQFSDFSQEFQEFRVRAIEVIFSPAVTSGTPTTGPYAIQLGVAPWRQFQPTSGRTLAQNDEYNVFSSLEERGYSLKCGAFENGKLWTTVGSTLVTDRDFGFSYIGLQTGPASSVLLQSTINMWVEFKEAQ